MALENAYNFKQADLVALSDISQGKQVTYAEIRARAESLQTKLKSVGVEGGHRIMVAFSDDINWIVSFLAITSLGAVLIPISPHAKRLEIEGILESYRVDGVLSDYEFLICHSGVFDDSFSIQYILTTKTRMGDLPVSLLPIFHDLSAMESSRLPLSIPAMDQILTCHFTYKGLGYPLAVEHCFKDYDAAVQSCQKIFGFKKSYKVLLLLPSYPVFGLVTNLLLPLSYGAQLFIHSSRRRNISRVVSEYAIDHVNIVPPIVDVMINEAEKYGEYDFSSTCFVSGGSFLSKDKIQIFNSLFKTSPLQGYGLTETLPVFTNHPEHNEPGSLGKMMRENVSVMIADSKGNQLPFGKTGEICLKGDGVCTEYANVNNPLPQVMRDGWLRTGDLGYLDKNWQLFFKGRRLPFCKVLGHMVDLRLIEQAALTISLVTRARCYTIRESGRKKLCLSLCVKYGFSMTRTELSNFFKERLSPPKCPSIFNIYTVSFHQVDLRENSNEKN